MTDEAAFTELATELGGITGTYAQLSASGKDAIGAFAAIGDTPAHEHFAAKRIAARDAIRDHQMTGWPMHAPPSPITDPAVGNPAPTGEPFVFAELSTK